MAGVEAAGHFARPAPLLRTLGVRLRAREAQVQAELLGERWVRRRIAAARRAVAGGEEARDGLALERVVVDQPLNLDRPRGVRPAAETPAQTSRTRFASLLGANQISMMTPSQRQGKT